MMVGRSLSLMYSTVLCDVDGMLKFATLNAQTSEMSNGYELAVYVRIKSDSLSFTSLFYVLY